MVKPDKFALLIIVFGCGILLASFLKISWIFVLAILVGWLAIALIGYLIKGKITFLLVLFFVFILTISFYNFSIFLNEKDSSQYLNNLGKIKVLGIINDEVDMGESSMSFKVKLEKPERGLVLVKTRLYSGDFQYGDLIEIIGEFKEPESYSDFDYKTYLEKQGIYSVVDYPQISLIQRNQGSVIKSTLLKIKFLVRNEIDELLPGLEAGFLKGLLLGDKQNLGEEFKNNLSKSGTSHLVALSGYNISIIATAILSAFLFLGINRRRAFWFSVLFIILFIIMVGASASVVRAAIMGILLLLGHNFGKIYHPRNALLFAALIMVILNPKIIRFDLGFQLSFLATFGLVYFSPWFEKIIKSDKESFLGWRQNLATTLSAQLAVMPLLISQFNNFSIIAPLTNVLVLTFIPITMLLGFITILLGLIFNLLGSVFGFFVYLLLKYEISVINYFGQLKFSSINFGKYSIYFSWLIIAIIFLMFTISKIRKIIYGKNK